MNDTQISTKALRTSDEILESLLAWRDALWEECKYKKVQGPNDPFLMINAILYRGYPGLTKEKR